MRNRRVAGVAAVALVVLAWAARPAAVPNNFQPDATFTGSSLSGWKPLGAARWTAKGGEITGTAEAGGGYLLLNKSFSDVLVYSSFTCAPGCTAGVVLRAEPVAGGGLKGILVSVTEGDLASYRVTVDGQGKEVSRERLRTAPGGQVRLAPPAPDPAAAGGAGRGQGGAAAPGGAPGQAVTAPGARGAAGPAQVAGARAGGAGRGGPQLLPNGQPAPIQRSGAAYRSGDWNTVELSLDANILRPLLNANLGIAGGVADDEFGRVGPIGVYVGAGEVRFKDFAYKDILSRISPPEQVSSRFRMQRLNEFYYSWGPDVSDVDHDGHMDIVAGGYYYRGPSFNERREIYLQQTIDPSTRYFNGQQYTYDFTGDGWPDVVNALFNQPIAMYVNPRGEPRRWDSVTIAERMSSELALVKDLDGDGKREFIFKDENNQLVWALFDPANPAAFWKKHPISESGPWPNHGMGIGAVNKDGRLDVLNAYGWWEQPAAGIHGAATWAYHPAAFGKWDRSSPGGAEMAVYDVNGDGVNDVVTSLQAHGWGLSWFEQKTGAGGDSTFVEHPIMGNFSTKNAGGVTFSEPHGSAIGDIDGDGIPDFITGKRLWSHLDTYTDPDPHGAPVLYVYRTVRNRNAPGGAEFVPELVHNRSGIGSAAAVYDLNKDGAPEIITSTKSGTFIFWNNWRNPAAAPAAR